MIDMRGADKQESIPLNWQQVFAKYGPMAAIAGFLIWFLTNQVSGNVGEIKGDLHDHIIEQRFYQATICKILAHQSGDPVDLCNPPQVTRH